MDEDSSPDANGPFWDVEAVSLGAYLGGEDLGWILIRGGDLVVRGVEALIVPCINKH